MKYRTRWERELPRISGLAANETCSVVTVGTLGRHLIQLDLDGETVWEQEMDSMIVHIGSDAPGKQLVVITLQRVYMMDEDGKITWEREASSAFQTGGLSPNGRYLATAEKTGKVFFYDREKSDRASGQLSLEEHPRRISITDKGRYIMALPHGGLLTWSGKKQKKWRNFSSAVFACASDRNGKLVAAGGLDFTLYGGENDGVEWTWETNGDIQDCAVAVDGSAVAVASMDETVAVLNQRGLGLWERDFQTETSHVQISSQGQRLVLAGHDGIMLFEEAETLAEVEAGEREALDRRRQKRADEQARASEKEDRLALFDQAQELEVAGDYAAAAEIYDRLGRAEDAAEARKMIGSE